MFKTVHRWLTHMPAVACGSLSQSCQWFSPVKQTKSTKVHFKLGNRFWLLLQLVVKLQRCPKPNNAVE